MDQSEPINEQHSELAEKTLDSLGSPEQAESKAAGEIAHDDLPKAAKERLGRQEKRHQKELRELRMQIQQLHEHVNSSPQSNNYGQTANSYTPQPVPEGAGIEHHINQAVNAALHARD